ncbi:MAG: hypothetical protein AB2A00_38230, partial [Myxococcota bacterium]
MKKFLIAAGLMFPLAAAPAFADYDYPKEEKEDITKKKGAGAAGDVQDDVGAGAAQDAYQGTMPEQIEQPEGTLDTQQQPGQQDTTGGAETGTGMEQDVYGTGTEGTKTG